MTQHQATTSTPAAVEMQTSSASAPPKASPPIVDPSPHAAPIAVDRASLQELLEAHPAPVSDKRTLSMTPNRYEDATAGPTEQISPTTWVEMTKPDGTTMLSPLSNVGYYRRKGYSEGAERHIPDLVAYWAERARQNVGEEREIVQTEEPDQTPEEVLQRYAGYPKTAEELEAERREVEDVIEGRLRPGESQEERRQREQDERQRRGQGSPPLHAAVPGPPAHAEGTPPSHAGPPEAEPKAP